MNVGDLAVTTLPVGQSAKPKKKVKKSPKKGKGSSHGTNHLFKPC